MRFSRNHGMDVVTRIAGPSHHYLGIEFGDSSAGEPIVEPMDRRGVRRESAPGEATPDDVRRRVSLGVARAGQDRHAALSIKRIRYALDDPWSPGAGEELAYALAMRAAEPGRPETGPDRG